VLVDRSKQRGGNLMLLLPVSKYELETLSLMLNYFDGPWIIKARISFKFGSLLELPINFS